MPDVQQPPQVTPQPTLQTPPQVDDASLAHTTLNIAASMPDPLNPPTAQSGKKKETLGSLDTAMQEIPGAQVIEHEPNVEVGPEVQGWIEKVEQEKINIPDQVVVADNTAVQPTGTYASSPVVVLPVTQEQMKQGVHASIKQSIRWLATWALRIIKKFHGSVVYRREAETQQ